MGIRPRDFSQNNKTETPRAVRATWLAAAFCVSALTLSSGCGGPPPPPGAKKELKDAMDAVEFASNNEARGDLSAALANLKEAQRCINEGKSKATDSERKKFRSLEDGLDTQIADMQTRIDTARKKREAEAEEAALKAKVKAKGADEDPEVKKKREAAEAKALAEKQKQEDMARLTATTGNASTKASKAKEEKKEEEEANNPTAVVAGGAPGPDGKKPEAKPVQTGPFKKLAEKPGAIQVDLVEGKGANAFAYIQIYNDKADRNRRIGRVLVRFRDAGNTELFDADLVCQYDKFDPAQKDVLDQNAVGAQIGMETHEIANQQALKVVAIAGGQKTDKVARAKRAMVTVVWADGGESTEVGPSTMTDDKPGGKSGVLPGL